MAQQLEQAKKHVEEFEQTRSVEALHQAIQSIQAVEVSARDRTSRITDRQEAMRAWMSVFSKIDENLDPNFDPQDVPAMNLIPPPVNGVTYPSGVDPKMIPDAKARAEYQKMLDENKRKAERYQFQDELRRLNERAESGFQMFARESFATASGYQSELERLLQDAKLSARRKEALKKAFRP